MKDSLILDTGSTISATVMNKNMVTNIRKADIPIVMTMNAGTKTLDTQADIPNFGKAMLDNTQTANVLGFSHLIEKFRVTYDSKKEDAFVIHTKWGPIKFKNRERLYVYEPSEKYFELIKDMKQLESLEKAMNDTEINNTPKSESEEKEKKVRFTGVAKVEDVNANAGSTPGTERNHTTAKENENTDITPTSDDGIVTETCHAIPSVSENLQKYNKRQIQ